MEDERTTEADPSPPPPSEGERADAEDTTPKDAPADPSSDPGTGGDTEVDAATAETASETPAPQRPATSDLPRTTTTGDDDQDLRSAGDGAVSGAPGDDLNDAAQRHD